MKKNKLVLGLSVVFAALFLFFVFKLTTDIKATEDNLLASKNIVDVTDSIETKLLVASENLSDTSWAQSTFNDDSWKTVQIPKHRIVSDPNFVEGNFAYYRVHIPKKSFQKVESLNNELFIALQHILFSKLDIYLNGSLYRSNSPVTTDEFLINIPIDEKIDNIVAIKGYIKTGDSGINHRSRIMVGKGSELNEVHRISYKKDAVYSLIFILCKGSILFVFVLIFFVVKVDSYFEKALLYGLFVIVEELITGNFLYQYLSFNQQVYLFDVVELGILTFLSLFLADVLGAKITKRQLIVFLFALAAPSLVISVDLLNTGYWFNVDHILRFWSYALIVVLGFFVIRVNKSERVLFSILLASLSITVWSAVFSAHPSLNFKAFGNLFIFFMVAYQTFILLRKQQNQLVEQEKDVAIGKTASILAHDVRRPLDQMSLILNRIASGEATEEFIKVAKQDVESSLYSVNNQISEMLNYIRDKNVNLSPISFYSILSSSIKQISSIKKNVSIDFKYDFKADVKILGEESRLGNVLTNLIANAFEAISDIGHKNNGNIRFSTEVISNQFCFSIVNDGPHIPESVIKEIFRPLATFGKSQGTGLGLAAALKVAQEHNGTIDVENVQPVGVKFTLRLGASSENDSIDLSHFKMKSIDYRYEIKTNVDSVNTSSSLRVFLLDDDKYVYEYLKDLVKGLTYDVELVHAADVDAAIEIVKSKRFDIYILDFDLDSKLSGLDFYNANLSYLKNGVVLHTNRDKATIPGLNLPIYHKPMSQQDLSLICESSVFLRQKILLVEDSRIITAGWKIYHGKENVKAVSSPEEAIKYLELSNDIDVCVVDYYFDNSSTTGEQLADQVLAKYPNLKIFICSSSSIDSKKFKVLKKNDYDIRKYL